MTREGWQYRADGRTIDLGSLVEGTPCDTIKVIGCKEISLFFVVVTIGTDVTVRVEQSPDDQNWAPVTTPDVVITENGTQVVGFDCRGVGYVRAKLIGHTDGTPTVSLQARVG